MVRHPQHPHTLTLTHTTHTHRHPQHPHTHSQTPPTPTHTHTHTPTPTHTHSHTRAHMQYVFHNALMHTTPILVHTHVSWKTLLKSSPGVDSRILVLQEFEFWKPACTCIHHCCTVNILPIPPLHPSSPSLLSIPPPHPSSPSLLSIPPPFSPGGTNFGFLNGANRASAGGEFQSVTTSYGEPCGGVCDH